MGFSRYLFHDFWTAREFNDMESKLAASKRRDARSRRNTKRQLEDMEDDMGRLALLTRALTEACIRKGVLTRNDIAAPNNEIDLADGVADGKLDPATLRTEEPEAAPPLRTAKKTRPRYKRR